MQRLTEIRERGISVVLGSYNRFWFLKHTIASIRKELKNLPHEIIVVDGGSIDGSLKWLIKQQDIITIIQYNRTSAERRSWGYFMNLGFKCAQGKYICMLSDDCLVIPGAITNGYRLLNHQLEQGEKTGAIAFFWRQWPFAEKYGVSKMGDQLYVDHGLYLNEALQSVGYIDEINYDFYFGDVDLCIRLAEQGYKCIESPDSYIEHYAHANIQIRISNNNRYQEDERAFSKNWSSKLGISSFLPARIEKEYQDPAFTVTTFNFYHRVHHPLKRLRHSIRKRLPFKQN